MLINSCIFWNTSLLMLTPNKKWNEKVRNNKFYSLKLTGNKKFYSLLGLLFYLFLDVQYSLDFVYLSVVILFSSWLGKSHNKENNQLYFFWRYDQIFKKMNGNRGCMLDAYGREASGEDEESLSQVNVKPRHKLIRHRSFYRRSHLRHHLRHPRRPRCSLREGTSLNPNKPVYWFLFLFFG